MVFSSDEGLSREKRYHLDVVHHFPDGIPVTFSGSLSIGLTGGLALTVIEAVTPPSTGPVKGSLSLLGGSMALTVDTTPGSESVLFQFEDDHNNPDAAPTGDGSGIVVTLASADDTQATVGAVVVGADANGNPTYTAPLTVVTTVPGSAVFTCTPANTSGAPLLEDDGQTAFPAIPELTVPITAGDPVEGSLSVAPTAV